jgi:two-component system response regulator HydG
MNYKLRILIVDDDQRMASTLADILELKGYETTRAHSGAEALEKIKAAVFDCTLTDVRMPGMNGVELFQELRKQQPGVPVVLMTAYSTDELIRQGLEGGAAGVLDKPLDIHQLLGFLGALSREHIVMVVDDDPAFCKTLGAILERRGFRVTKIIDPHVDVDQMIADAQIILLDMNLNDITGYDVLKEIRLRHPTLPVLLVTGYRQEMSAAVQQALEFNAYACLYKPLVIPELLETLAKIKSARMKELLKAG